MENEKIKFSSTEKKMYIVVIIIILLVVIATIWNARKPKNTGLIANNENITEQEIQDDENQKLIAALQQMEERERMEYYFNLFLDYVEGGMYEKAYNLLYEDFRNTYFPTLADFQKYIPTVFSDMMDIEHVNIERSGDVYILWIAITDTINGKPGEQKEMNIVIQERDYNDFVLSFSVV